MSAVRIAFLGTPEAAVPALQAFLDAPGFEVAAVVTNPDRPAGRGQRLTPPPVKVLAQQAGVPVWQPVKAREILQDLTALDVDACAVVAYGTLLPVDVLAAGGAGFVNLHFSLLPAWRGAAPVTHALLAGDRRTGVTCFVIEQAMDTGPMLATLAVEVGPRETAGELTARLAAAGAPLLVTAVSGLVDGSLHPTPQDHALATLAPKVHPDDAAIDWSADAAAIDRAVRAFNPAPGAWTTFHGERLKLHAVTPFPDEDLPDAPGMVHAGADRVPRVATGAGCVRLDVVQPAGKPRMDGLAFANGHRPAGAVLS